MSATLEQPSTLPGSRDVAVSAVEMPTLALILLAYGGWLILTFSYGRWPLAVIAPLTAVLIILHSSLQHEILHGHPTRLAWLNRLFGVVPLSLWLPYDRYRVTHLVHHHDDRLTDPLDDPESYYWTAEQWKAKGPLSRGMLGLQQTLAGRVLLGSFWRPALWLVSEARAVWRNEPGLRAVWAQHLLWCVPVVLWIKLVCHMPPWIYLVCMVIPANGILLIRSFAEHRAVGPVRERVAIVEGSRILAPLFLYNSLHSLHHESPGIPWYRYNEHYRRERTRLIAENGGLVYQGYADLARRYLFWPHDVLVHPTGRAPGAGQAGSA
ncbi:MAG: fatty acid desaturase [Steroidobacteraceae bacterium]